MTFNSIVFLLCFLPLSLGLYYLMPARGKNLLLLALSLVFYCWGGVDFLPLILLLIAVSYLAALLMDRPGRAQRARRALLVGAVAVSVAVLAWFKYAALLIPLLKRIAAGGLAGLRVQDALPLGISYYTFKLISYCADVYQGRTQAERDPLVFALYVLFFPQLIVGPIVRYRDMQKELHDPAGRCTVQRMEEGAELLVFGLAKKVILADGIGALWQGIIADGGIGLARVGTPLAWLGIVAYSLQLYFDFCGFSQMSNGLSALLGFSCAPNFDLPYISSSLTEFWRRWHISLSGWFRDYVYIPLGGNRRGLPRQLLNLLAVWILTGIWHGTQWNFLCWGLYYFVLLSIEKLFLLPYLKRGRVWPRLYTLLCVAVGWALFTANAEGAPLRLLLGKLFLPQGGVGAAYYLRHYGVTLALCIVCSTSFPQRLWRRVCRCTPLRLVLFAALMMLCTAFVVASTSQAALYAEF